MARYFVFALEKGLNVLEAFNYRQKSLSLSEISKFTKMNMPSTTRYIRTLIDLGYLDIDIETKRYSLTSKVLSLGFTFLNNIDLRKRLHPYMLRINRKYDINVSLAIFDGTDIIFIERIIGSSLSNIDYKIGTRLPAYCSGLGRCFLAFMSEEESKKILDASDMKKFNKHTITDKEILQKKFIEYKNQGYATAHNQFSMGWYNYAVPIIINKKVEASLGASFTEEYAELKKQDKNILRDLLKIAEEVSGDGRV